MKYLIIIATIATLTLARPQVNERVHFPNKRPTGGTVPKTVHVENAIVNPIDQETTIDEVRVPAPKNYVPHEFERKQNEAARYEFSSNIDDHISDLTHQRSETREGLAVRGMYSYSDGYYQRTVHYEADQNGYRITGMEAVPLDGPQIDLTGTASVETAAHGRHVAYRVQSVPVEGPVAKVREIGEI
ncbi:uncharacterized protein LOC132706398 [Cylas formicarius]|uniref:uncharacterized protein LOC132706398 n=1 Tax=Cylas formicarius TaxID=197179 RepID=UPI0029583498|nr:uncharacterized protein LOC132706398 [Cylas formicarius]